MRRTKPLGHKDYQKTTKYYWAVAPDATGQVGGRSLIVDAITSQVEQDLRTGEAIALPVALVIMILVFGGFLAASMPMLGYQHSRARGRTCAGRRSQRG